ncbi:hypothetical protein Ccrd_008381 [Cynara cardunculus var. scolymus]|uniref:BTB/POZ-like protein n=1 Tax=Cynara cardunculus var. scolymus TaxID=59895 RepID=A0A103XFA9_CYNCS|nr:hypothetical protein Ccrd_008381 [Cynara cardunculus var. scolymus]
MTPISGRSLLTTISSPRLSKPFLGGYFLSPTYLFSQRLPHPLLQISNFLFPSMRALLCSGMQESQSESIKVDLGWKALVRLVEWFYSGKLLPKPKYGCLWHNLNEKEKFDEVIPYVELYCLSDSWLLEDLHKECLRVIAACLDSVNMSIKIIQIVVVCFQWDLVELAAKFIAPHYQHLHISGDLLELNEELVDVIHVASVRLSQQGDHI